MPIPEDMGECIKHFESKGKPRKQAVAICVSYHRDRSRETAHEIVKRKGYMKAEKQEK